MLLFAIFIAVLACAHGSDDRIVGGAPTTIDKIPYQVALLYYNRQVCGGSIISRNFILTAAHCIYGTSAPQWQIRAGSSLHNSGGQVKQVNKITRHYQYDNNRLNNDIALLQLTSALNLGSNVALVNLPNQGQFTPADTPVQISGWGKLSERGTSPMQLHRATVNIISHLQCLKAYSSLTENMICAGILNGGRDTCQGDSGGPLNIMAPSYTQIGITSWGVGCARPGLPGVYTRVSNYILWIRQNLI